MTKGVSCLRGDHNPLVINLFFHSKKISEVKEEIDLDPRLRLRFLFLVVGPSGSVLENCQHIMNDVPDNIGERK